MNEKPGLEPGFSLLGDSAFNSPYRYRRFN